MVKIMRWFGVPSILYVLSLGVDWAVANVSETVVFNLALWFVMCLISFLFIWTIDGLMFS